jgi:hypothetical protein
MSDTTEIEKKSLEAHVELCAERYRALESQFMEVKKDISEVKELAEKTHSLVNKLSEKRNTQLINWGTGIIVFLLGIIGYLLKFHIN